MPRFWRNPEFVRNRRAELRPVRAITVALVVIVMCALLGMACWSFEQTQRAAATKALERDTALQTWLLFYRWLVGLQGMALMFRTLFMCAQ